VKSRRDGRGASARRDTNCARTEPFEQRQDAFGGRQSLLKGTSGKPVTPRVLLKELQLRGLVSRKQYNVVPPKVEYSLTDRGRGLQRN
jgi:DNA-binding HxlR family transcriptional regulator